MRRGRDPDLLHVCDKCGTTVLCSAFEVWFTWKWERHQGHGPAGEWTLLLCEDCKPPKEPAVTRP